ncbi:MAG: bifunctional riboflavin kinase/FAD synthetase [Christensenellales bacterium]|jgi:riboflavin kinase/FMN adenylyltransferase
MKYWTRIPVIAEPVVMTIGNFDGIHIGHRALLDRVGEIARQSKSIPAVVTFANHSLELIDPPRAPRLLMDAGDKMAVMADAGAAHMIVLPFDTALASMEPDAFIGLLLESICVMHIVVGFDFRFGRGGAGEGTTLARIGAARGFGVTVMPPVLYEDKPVSSSRIRSALLAGDCASAAAMLGRPYALRGTVVSGHGIGRKLGYPTANIRYPDGLLVPRSGVYAAKVQARGRWYAAMVNIGTRPTARECGGEISIEAHLLHYEGSLYGEKVCLMLLERIRDERPFESWDALRKQLDDDREQVLNRLRVLKQLPKACHL